MRSPRSLAGRTGGEERHDILSQFAASMLAAGIETDEPIIADGTLHRFHIGGQKRGSMNGAYVLHMDGIPAGWFMDFQTGFKTTWRANGNFKPIEVDPDAKRRRREAANDAARAAAAIAQRTWESSSVCQGHPYLDKKSVRPDPILRVTPRGNLVVPIWDVDGRWLSLQAITANGRKQFLRGGRIAGGMCWLGTYAGDFWIAEGLATGLSIQQATEDTVFVAFTCKNLRSVATSIRDCFPDRRIIIASDNDATPGNPGRQAAEAAAEAVDGLVAIPPHFGDWNDHLEAAA